MRIYLKDLSKDLQVEVRGILRGNGLNASMVRLYKDGKAIVAEHKRTGDRWKIIF